MEITSLCLVLSALSVRPDRQQFFWYESPALTCAEAGLSGGWKLKRNTSLYSHQECSDWGVSNGSTCTIRDAYPSDTGVYWCESEEQRRCSNSISINVTGGPVILEIPALPVTEGDKVTLRCRYKEGSENGNVSSGSSVFYKDGVFFGTEPTGTKTWLVSKCDEGFYTCQHSKDESPQSRLTVNARAEPPPFSSVSSVVCVVLLVVLYLLMSIVCLDLCRQRLKARAQTRR